MKDKEWFLERYLFLARTRRSWEGVSKVIDRGEKRSSASHSLMCDHHFLRNVVTNRSKQTKVWERAKFLRLPFLSCDILYVLIITCSVYCNREETCFVTFSYRSAQIFITAPNIFHLGVEETISVILYNTDKPVNVTVIAQDFPDKKRNLSAANGVFARGKRLFIAKFTLFLFISNVKK